MLDEKTIEKMFEEWANQEIPSIAQNKGQIGSISESVYYSNLKAFTASINLLLPIIQKQDEAIGYYSDTANWTDDSDYDLDEVSISSSDWETSAKTDGYFCGGKLARFTQKEVSEMIKRLGGDKHE